MKNQLSPARLTTLISADPVLAPLVTSVTQRDARVEMRLPLFGNCVVVTVAPAAQGDWEVGLRSPSAHVSTWYRETFVVDGKVTDRPWGETLLLRSGLPGTRRDVMTAVHEVVRLVHGARRQQEAGSFSKASHFRAYWWSNQSNFGDAIGPFLGHHITGRRPVHSRRRGFNQRVLLSVGSLFSAIHWKHADVWGTGLMFPLEDEHVQRLRRYDDVIVHAVRGKLTRAEVIDKLGWSVPEVYGDPALLLPRYLPAPAGHGRVAEVAHFTQDAGLPDRGAGVERVDVREDLRTVVAQIAGASAVVSSSLHGLIVAQAYGVPWVWIEVTDRQLGGADFKFRDFFSCLAPGTEVAHRRMTLSEWAAADPDQLAREATLPKLDIDLDALLASFPGSPAKAEAIAPQLPLSPRSWLRGSAPASLSAKAFRLLARRARILSNRGPKK